MIIRHGDCVSVMAEMIMNSGEAPCAARIDPVHEHDGRWWFWDECWSVRMGPHDTEAKARSEMQRYCEEVLGL